MLTARQTLDAISHQRAIGESDLPISRDRLPASYYNQNRFMEVSAKWDFSLRYIDAREICRKYLKNF